MSSDHVQCLRRRRIGVRTFAQTFYGPAPFWVALWRSGSTEYVRAWTQGNDYFDANPALDSAGNAFNIEALALVKRDPSGAQVWSHAIAGFSWVVGGDVWDGVHVADTNHLLWRYDSDGNPVWSLILPSDCTAFAADASGNRFLSMRSGGVARLGAETLVAPAITVPPQGQTLFFGSNIVLTVGVSGSTPFQYQWLFQSNSIAGATNATLNRGPATAALAGWYSVIVSNVAGAVTSAPVLVRVKSVQLYVGNQMLTNGTYVFETPPTLSIRSVFTNGAAFYTLDGSPPDFGDTLYTGPFALLYSATVRAIGYSADWMQSEEADAPSIFVGVQHTLSASSAGGGTVTLDPPGGTYSSTSIVSVTAVPAVGWTFLQWLGDASGSTATIDVAMGGDKAVRAVFGTTLSTTVAGSGQVLLCPSNSYYPYGTVVRLTGVPQPGNYFGFWGNAATGNTNPLYFAVTAPNPTVSSIFGSLGSTEAALTVLIEGRGRVNVDPRANAYPTNQSAALTALPDAGQDFLGWSGGAGGMENPLVLSMSQSKVITASFSSRPGLSVDPAGLNGLTPDGFRFTLAGDPSGRLRNLHFHKPGGLGEPVPGNQQLRTSAGFRPGRHRSAKEILRGSPRALTGFSDPVIVSE